jgi:hypothetical protein
VDAEGLRDLLGPEPCEVEIDPDLVLGEVESAEGLLDALEGI